MFQTSFCSYFNEIWGFWFLWDHKDRSRYIYRAMGILKSTSGTASRRIRKYWPPNHMYLRKYVDITDGQNAQGMTKSQDP